MADVTEILRAIENGDRRAAGELLPLVYDELRRLAAARMARETPGQTLDATGLVHEAYLRLVAADGAKPGDEADTDGSADQRWDGRGHFFAAAAEAMRRILVENARRKRSLKRGGDLVRSELEGAGTAAAETPEEIVAVSEALDRLALVDPEAAKLVNLRYFAGLSIPDVAQVLGVSPRTADRLWAYARSWIHEAMTRE